MAPGAVNGDRHGATDKAANGRDAPNSQPEDSAPQRPPKPRLRISASKKVTVRSQPSSSSLNSLSNQVSVLNLDSDEREGSSNSSKIAMVYPSRSRQGSLKSYDDSLRLQSLLNHVSEWMQQERDRLDMASRKRTAADLLPLADRPSDQKTQCHHVSDFSRALDQLDHIVSRHSSGSASSTTTATTDRPIGPSPSSASSSSSSGRLDVSSSSSTIATTATPLRGRTASAAPRGLRRGSTSESDYADADLSVPSADVVLDNSMTLLYSGGEADSDPPPSASSNEFSTCAAAAAAGTDTDADAGAMTRMPLPPPAKDGGHWLRFKSEILRLTHTLGFRGWRRVPLNAGGAIEVVRLSGALTNAVYLVSPPRRMPDEMPSTGIPRKPPPKLLLRIYGPQVEHLIDREHELRILRRLAKKNIGPRVLGTFRNGRFEQYFHARPLTARELRVPETSVQIAKRMRELHDGIDLLPEERAAGPTVWKNWDKWVTRCEQVITWLDSEVIAEHTNSPDEVPKEAWRKRGYVCGVPWSMFRRTVERYRKWLEDVCGGTAAIRQKLVFAHNDTQYGNLLRLEPSGEYPLLLPANEHKQLVVIDFEYASANTQAIEFANHFSEWCYNYHDADRAWACRATWYPTIEEQERFIRAYLKHRLAPAPNPSYPSSLSVGSSGASSFTSSPRITPFTLDSHEPHSALPPSSGTPETPTGDSRDRNATIDAETAQLLRETRLWRIANSAQWVAWGIVQAKIPGLEAALSSSQLNNNNDEAESNSDDNDGEQTPTAPQPADPAFSATASASDAAATAAAVEQVKQEVAAAEAADEFDYLAYAQDRAFFFWADMLSLGLVREEDFPAGVLEHVKKRIIGR